MRLPSSQPVRPRSLIAAVAAAALLAPLGLGGLPAPAHAAPDGVEGTGDPREPYLVDEAADLHALADAINSGDTSRSSHIELTQDIDMGEEEFTGFATFSGTLDGHGHTISDITYGPDAASGDGRAFVHTLDGGTLANLTLDDVTADTAGSTGFAAGLAIYAVDATITGNTVTGATLTSEAGEKAGGLVAETDGGTIEDNFVSASVTAHKMPAGITAYAKGAASVSRNLVDADLTMLTPGGDDGSRGHNAGLVVGYPGTPNSGTFTQNVALAGSVDGEGKVDGFLGRIIGFTGYDGWSAEQNLANSDITVAGETVDGPGEKKQHGTGTSAADLAQKSTYEDLGWDFTNTWAFDDTVGHPVPQYSYSLPGAGTEESPYEVATAEDLEFLAEQINADNAKYTDAQKYVLAADLDFSDRAPFVGLDRLSAEFDGQGHTLTGLTYAPSEDSQQLGLVRELDGGALRNLTLDGVTAQSESTHEGDYVAALAVIAQDAQIEGVSVAGADLQAPGVEKTAGAVAEARGTTTIERTWVDGSVGAKKMAAGIAAYATDATQITQTISTASLSVQEDGGSGTRGIDAAHVLAYPGSGNSVAVEANVAHSGDIAYTGEVPGYAGRIVGYHQPGTEYELDALSDNLGGEDITIGGAAAGDDEQNGTGASAAELRSQETYEGLGWDFTEDWTLDEDRGHPVPRYIDAGDRPDRITTTIAGDPQTARGFTWYAQNSDAGQVTLSTSREFTNAIEVSAERGEGRDEQTFFQARADDLEPGSRYFYRVGDPDSGVWSRTGSFTTNDGEGDFSFVDLTDTQSQNQEEAELSASTMAKAMQTVPGAEFLMHNGDVVEDGGRERDWEDMLGAAEDTLLNTTIVPAAGNHDEAEDSFVDHFALDAPNDQDTSTGAYYSFDYNAAHFSVLNTNEDSDQAVSQEQIDWLRDDVTRARDNGAKWTIVTMHKGPYTTANHLDDADIRGMRQALVPLIDELNIDLVLQGHDHVMSRTKALVHDPDGVEGAAPVERDTITEIRDGKRTEYGVDPDGTVYFLPNTAGAKHYGQAQEASGFDLEEYLQLFDRTGGRDTENFTGIRVTDDRLTVDVYDIKDEGQPRLFESFGIDREVAPVDDAIADLPAVDDLTAGDAEAVAEVRSRVDELTAAQRGGLENLEALEEREQRIRELTGAASTDGAQIAWAVDDASERRAVTVRNDTDTARTDVPVKVRIENTPDVEADEFGVTGLNGAPLPHEVEAWDPGGESTVWVRIQDVPAHGAATVWGYFGTHELPATPQKVWESDYALVEHFADSVEEGGDLTDSTGRGEGKVVGGDLTTEVEAGDGRAALGDTRIQYPGDVGGQADRFAISAVVSLTPEQAGSVDGTAPIVAKENASGDGEAAFRLGYDGDAGGLDTRFRGNSFEFGDVDIEKTFDFPTDGEDHLVSQVYDGMTYSVFIDGEEVHSEMIEYRSTMGDLDVPTTIGDFATEDSELSSPFPGTVSEVQIAGTSFSPDHEAFRHANLLGDAVSVADPEARDGDDTTIILEAPAAGTTVEAGNTTVTGTLSQRSEVTAQVAGVDVLTETVDAGAFSIEVPVGAPGDQDLELTAASESGGTATASVPLVVEDTRAPAQPDLEDTADQATGADAEVTMTSTPHTDYPEELSTTFHADATVPLNADTTVVREGSSPDRTPEEILPDSGEVAGASATEQRTAASGENPYQIHEISLSTDQAEQARADGLHFSWEGSGDDRQVSAHLWDHEAEEWVLEDTDSDPEGGGLVLDVETEGRTDGGPQAIADDGTVSLLVWRGLPEDPTTTDRDPTVEPDPTAYDWGMDHVPDTQLYAQTTPELMHHQFEYLVDRADERNTQMVVQAGDWVNREYLSQEYQWKNAEPAAVSMEEAGLPYMISWGNHDYTDERNGRVMLPKYFPHERFEESLEGTPWTFGGSNSIDNYYYTGEIDGAELLMLEVGFFSADDPDDEGLAWARDVLEQHPDHTVILATHQSVGIGENNWANEQVMNQLIDPYPQVKLVLGGHIAGTGVASHTRDDGSVAYGILTDYQSRVYGGQEYMRHLSIDAENGLLYSNTYSPLLDTTTSDGDWHTDIDPENVPGFHGEDSENFVIDLDLGGETERTLSTDSLTLSVGEPVAVAEAVETAGTQPASVVLTGVQPDVEYAWFADLTDPGGNVTRTPMQTFTVGESEDDEGDDGGDEDGGDDGDADGGGDDGDDGSGGDEDSSGDDDGAGDDDSSGDADGSGDDEGGSGDDDGSGDDGGSGDDSGSGDDDSRDDGDGGDSGAESDGDGPGDGDDGESRGDDDGDGSENGDDAPEDDLGGHLPRTGSDLNVPALVATALAVILLGSAAVFWTRRRSLRRS